MYDDIENDAHDLKTKFGTMPICNMVMRTMMRSETMNIWTLASVVSDVQNSAHLELE